MILQEISWNPASSHISNSIAGNFLTQGQNAGTPTIAEKLVYLKEHKISM